MSRAAPLDRSRPPAPGPPEAFRFPPFDRRLLDDGSTELWAAPLAGAPLIHLEFLAPAGCDRDPGAEPGLASFTAALLDDGTEQRSATEIALAIEQLGGGLETGAGWDAAWISTSLLAIHASAGLELVADVARRPVFPETEVERNRRRRLVEIRRRRDQPGYLAGRAFARALYGDAVYGRPTLGSETSIAALSRSGLARFHGRHYIGPGCALLAVGGFDPDALARTASDLLAACRSAPPAPAPPEALPPPPETSRCVVVDRPEAAQTELRIGHIGIPRSHPDYTGATVLNSLLGGKFTSRLNLTLRERLGVTYGVSSRFSARRLAGPFVVGAAVATESTGLAAEEIRHAMERLREEPVGVTELEETRRYLIGVFPYTVQTLAGIAARLETLAVHRLPLDTWQRLPTELAAVTPAEIARLASELLHPEALVVAAVGPARQLVRQLESFAPVEVLSPDEI